ncbi:hypothetical protein TWF281_004159 [Arthrobotrys megalospora]
MSGAQNPSDQVNTHCWITLGFPPKNRHPPPTFQYGGGHIETTYYQTPVYQVVKLWGLKQTAYVTDYPTFRQHQLERPEARQAHNKGIKFRIGLRVKVDGTYRLQRTMAFDANVTLDELVEEVIAQEHGLHGKTSDTQLPRKYGFAFNLIYEDERNGPSDHPVSLMWMVNEAKRLGKTVLAREQFASVGPIPVLTWKEYDDDGDEWENPICRTSRTRRAPSPQKDDPESRSSNHGDKTDPTRYTASGTIGLGAPIIDLTEDD